MKTTALIVFLVSSMLGIPVAAAQSQTAPQMALTDELIVEISEARGLAARTNNEDYLLREVLYFAKRHRFVTVNDTVLAKADRFTIQLFDDTAITVEKREFKPGGIVAVWRGVVVDPVLPTAIMFYPSGAPVEKQLASDIHERMNSVTIYARILPSFATDLASAARSIRLGVQVPALKDATFVMESLRNDPLVHVVYELDRERCCFSTVDTPLDPGKPANATMLERERAYREYIKSLDEAQRQDDSPETRQ